MEEKTQKVEPTKKMTDILDSIESMTVLELADLVKVLEDKFGVSAAAITQEASRSKNVYSWLR